MPKGEKKTMRALEMRRRAGAFAAAATLATAIWLAGPNTSSAQEFYGTLKKINDTNTVTVGSRDSSIPSPSRRSPSRTSSFKTLTV